MSPGFFKALCHPSRLFILARLAESKGPCTVSRVAEGCPVDISVVSRHLSVLRQAGILESSRRGKEVYYSVRISSLARTLRAMADAFENCCPSRKSPSPCCSPSGARKDRDHHEET